MSVCKPIKHPSFPTVDCYEQIPSSRLILSFIFSSSSSFPRLFLSLSSTASNQANMSLTLLDDISFPSNVQQADNNEDFNLFSVKVFHEDSDPQVLTFRSTGNVKASDSECPIESLQNQMIDDTEKHRPFVV